LIEVGAVEGDEPVVSTNLSGKLFVVKRSPDRGVVRMATFVCPSETEDSYISALYDQLWALSSSQGWRNRCTLVSDAVGLMEARGIKPVQAVVPSGYDGDHGIVLHSSSLGPGCAMVFAAPEKVGTRIRSGDAMGLMLRRVSETVVLVGGP